MKLQKTYNDSLTSYKNSLSDVKLIYNKDETVKRYQQCELSFKNVISEEKIIKERADRVVVDKKQVVSNLNSLGGEFKSAYLFVGEKVANESKNTLSAFCLLHKSIITDIGNKKELLEKTRIGTFLDSVPEHSELAKCFHPFEQPFVGKYPIFL